MHTNDDTVSTNQKPETSVADTVSAKPKADTVSSYVDGYVLVWRDPAVHVFKDYTSFDASKLMGVIGRYVVPNPDVIDNRKFLESVFDFYSRRGFITPKQYYAVCRALRQMAADYHEIVFDASQVRAAFDAAEAANLGKPAIKIKGYRILRDRFAPSNLAVLDDDEGFVGKITGDQFAAHKGKLRAGYDYSKLEALFADFHAAVKQYGKLTNTCGCCGRHLTDPISVERGIGPICEKHYGFAS